jgi:hypothetical protein
VRRRKKKPEAEYDSCGGTDLGEGGLDALTAPYQPSSIAIDRPKSVMAGCSCSNSETPMSARTTAIAVQGRVSSDPTSKRIAVARQL